MRTGSGPSGQVRTVSANLDFRDKRLLFDAVSGGTTSPGTYQSFDSDVWSSGILQVVIVDVSGSYYLRWRYHANPDSTWTNTWEGGTTVRVTNKSGVGLWGNRVFYQAYADNDIYYADFQAGTPPTFGTPVKLRTITNSDPYYPAPVSSTEIYAARKILVSEDNYNTYIYYMTASVEAQWPGAVFGAIDSDLIKCDAIRYVNRDHIYITDSDMQRVDLITREYDAWSELQSVIPLDLVDDTSAFYFGGVSNVNGKVVVTGSLWRMSSSPFHAYMFLNSTTKMLAHSMGRDMYVSGPSGYIGGKMHFITNKVYYDYLLGGYKADATMLVGYDNTSKRHLDTNVADITFENELNGPGRIISTVAYSEATEATIRPGAEVAMLATVSGAETQMGVFTLDSVVKDHSQEGSSLTIVGKTSGLGAMAKWRSDADYAYQSQIKHSCTPSLMSQMVRAVGRWGVHGDGVSLKSTKLNDHSIAYSANSSIHNGMARCKFFAPSGTNFTPLHGLVLNLYRNTDSTQENPPEADYYTFCAAVYGNTEHQGGSGIAVYFVNQGTWTKINSHSLSITTDVYHWLQFELADGKYVVKYRLDSSTTWTVFEGDMFSAGDPWQYGVGRAGIYIKNRTPNTTTTGIDSENTVIPVLDTANMTGTVIIDDEQITVSGVCAANPGTLPTGMSVYQGTTFLNASHQNANWTEGVLMWHEPDQSADQNLNDTDDRRYVGRTINVEGTITVKGVEMRAKKVGTPTADLYCYIAKPAWDNNSPPSSDDVLAYDNIPVGSVGTSYGWLRFDFDIQLSEGSYWLVLTNCIPTQTPTNSGTNYYKVEVDEDVAFKEGIMKVYGSPTGWRERTPKALLPYHIIGVGVKGHGYEIYINGVGSNWTRAALDDFALVVTAGNSKGRCFRISDYDYQAPDQWTPNRSYDPPDRWQDHVGDLAHGSWVTPSARRIFVLEDPREVTEDLSTRFAVYRGVVVSARGANGTTAVSHGENSIVSYYQNLSVRTPWFEMYSSDVDLGLGDVFNGLCWMAGVASSTASKLASSTYSPTHGGWAVVTDLNATGKAAEAVIASFRLEAWTEAGMAVGVETPATWVGGKVVTVKTDGIRVYDDVQDRTLEEFVPFPTFISPYGWVTISYQQNKYLSVWINNRLIHTFYTVNNPTGAGCYAGFVSNGAADFYISWKDADDMLIPQFYMESGKSGHAHLQRLIGEKKFYFRDSYTGTPWLFRSRETLSGTYTYIALGGTHQTDADLVTRLRVEGVSVYESNDNMREFGNMYDELAAEEVKDTQEARAQSLYLLDQSYKKVYRDGFTGVADIRLEPGDIITVDYPGDTGANVIAEAVQFIINTSVEQAIFDMRVEGYRNV